MIIGCRTESIEMDLLEQTSVRGQNSHKILMEVSGVFDRHVAVA